MFFSIPSGLITTSANGQKGHKELQLIMKTAIAKFAEGTTLLIQGIKGKIGLKGNIKDFQTEQKTYNFIESFKTITIEKCLN